MRIRLLRLKDFRNYAHLALAPAEGVTVLYGENAQGKTNLIEAVHLCCLGRSHRTNRDAELVRFGEPSAQVSVDVLRREGPLLVSVRIDPQEKRKKLIHINHTQVQRIGELMGHMNAVLFSPEDLRLVKDGPEGRRRFLDMEVSQLQPAYFYALQRYMRALSQRNELLRSLSVSASPALYDSLDAWDTMLSSLGGEIVTRRARYLEKLSRCAGEIHSALSGGREALSLSYAGNAEDERQMLSLLRAARQEDMRRRTTSIGPHRDDIRISLSGRDARSFASQGQQRTAALSIKLAEIEVLREETSENPILLLDDVMSELDVRRREMLAERISTVQTLITCTHLSDLGGAAYDAAYCVEAGTIAI